MNKKLCVLGLSGAAAAGFLYYENKTISVSSYKFGTGNKRFRITQVSDLHGTEFGKNNEKLFICLREQNPDIIAVTGDLIFSYNPQRLPAERFVREASKIAPIYFVTGNHEERLSVSRRKELEELITSCGGTVLDNDEVLLDDGKFILRGVSDRNLAAANLNTEPADRPLVLLAHEPQYIELFKRSSADIILTGHAHGGQIRLPIVGGLQAPCQGMLPKYTAGCHYLGKTKLIISRGLGRSIFPFRVFNRPELVNIDLYL